MFLILKFLISIILFIVSFARESISIARRLLMPMVFSLCLLIEPAFSIDLFTLWLVLNHDDLEADPPEFHCITNPQVEASIKRGYLWAMLLCKFDYLPSLVCRLDFLLFVIFNQKFVVEPKIACNG